MIGQLLPILSFDMLEINRSSMIQGLRLDGRKAGELRRIQCRMGVFGQADGSAYLEQGNTKVFRI